MILRPIELARAASVAALAALAGLAGCGIPLDGAPRRLVDAPENEVTTTTAPTGGGSAYVYLTLEDHLVPIRVDVGDASPQARVTALLSIEPDSGAASQIPSGTRLLAAERNASVVTVDLSDEFDNVQGTGRRLAAAELVFTLTEIGGIEDVLFEVSGRPTRVDSPIVGDTDRVRACDYLALLPTTDQLREDRIDSDAARHVTARRTSLQQRCPAALAGDGADG